MTPLESAVLRAIDSRVAQHDADTEVHIKALNSAVDDLIAAQTAFEVKQARLVRWLEAMDGAVDLENAKAMARAALRGDKEPPNNQLGGKR